MKTERFDHLWAKFLEQSKSLSLSVKCGRNAWAEAKKNAYKMAHLYVHMFKSEQRRLVDMIKSSKKSVDDFLSEAFGPISWLGDAYAELLHAVDLGMTEEQYGECTAAVYIARHRTGKRIEQEDNRAGQASTGTAGRINTIQQEQRPELPVAEDWESRALKAETEVKELKSRLAKRERYIVRLERQIKQMQPPLGKRKLAMT